MATVSLALAGVAGAAVGTMDPPQDVAWRNSFAAAVRSIALKDPQKTEQLFQQAMQATSKFPAGDPKTGMTLNTLGLYYKEERKFGEAGKAFQQALGIFEKAYGPDSVDVGNVSFNIASVLTSQGQYDGALPYLNRSHAVYAKLFGEESLKAVSVLCQEGVAYRTLKKYDQAEQPLKECANMRESSGGVENADLAEALYNLALVYIHQGKFALADPRLKMAEKIRELTLGVMSTEFAEVLEAHGALLRQMGRDKEAERDETLAAAIRRHEKK